MSYANWNPTAFYLTDDIVIYNGEDYKALADNTNTIPSAFPLIWDPIAPVGPGPSNQLAFNQPTTDLSIVGGNTIDISPVVLYNTPTDPVNATLRVGNTALALNSVPTIDYTDTTANAPAKAVIFGQVNADPLQPFDPYPLLEFQWIKQPGNQNKRFTIDVGDGITTLTNEWVGQFYGTIATQSDKLQVKTGTGAGTGIEFDAGGPTGNLYQDAAGDLFWNGTKLNVGGGATIVSQLCDAINVVGSTPFPIPSASTGAVPWVLTPAPSLFADYLANGAPDALGAWRLDFSGWSFRVDATGLNNSAYIQFVDNTTIGGPYTYSPTGRRNQQTISSTEPPYYNLNFGNGPIFDVATARATGMRTIDAVEIVNSTSGNMILDSWTDVYGLYLPNGVQ